MNHVAITVAEEPTITPFPCTKIVVPLATIAGVRYVDPVPALVVLIVPDIDPVDLKFVVLDAVKGKPAIVKLLDAVVQVKVVVVILKSN